MAVIKTSSDLVLTIAVKKGSSRYFPIAHRITARIIPPISIFITIERVPSSLVVDKKR